MSHIPTPAQRRFTTPARLFTHTLAVLLELRSLAQSRQPAPLSDADAARYLASAAKVLRDHADFLDDVDPAEAHFYRCAARFGAELSTAVPA